jgi:hypothetical protein
VTAVHKPLDVPAGLGQKPIPLRCDFTHVAAQHARQHRLRRGRSRRLIVQCPSFAELVFRPIDHVLWVPVYERRLEEARRLARARLSCEIEEDRLIETHWPVFASGATAGGAGP